MKIKKILKDRLLLKMDEPIGKKGNIYIPEIAKPDRSQKATILMVGESVKHEMLKKGTKVLVSIFAGIDVELKYGEKKEQYKIADENEILAILEE
jgi:co-chaperonin GroES (HSP10)